jgi:PHD/YefM family antitoxin component YafN of YafNO toxin-antitoxin module
MPVKLNSSQVQQRFGRVVDQALGEDIIIERYGSPRVALVAYRRYRELLEAEEELLRTRLRAASEAASTRAEHLSDEEVEVLIERAREEAHQELAP